MTFKVKEGVQVGSTLALDANGKLTTGLSTGRSISLSGDVAGSATFDGTSNINISTTVQANSVALGTDTTGNYMVDVTAGTGVSVSHTQGEGSTATVSIGQAVATTSNVTFANINASGNLVIDGNLTVNGTTTTISAANLAIEDNLIYLNEGSTTANPDLGITGNYNDGTYAHAGVFRDATDNRWKFFKGYTPEPSTSIDTTHASFAYADVQAATFYGALSGNASTASAWQTARTLSYTGDVTGSMSVNGSANVSTALTLANSGVTAGSYGSGTAIPVLTIDAKGRITAASTSVVTIGDGAMTVTAGSGLTGGGQVGTANQTGASSVTISHADTSSVANVTAATNTFISGITFDTYGHVQTVTTGAPSGFASSTHYHDRIYNGASGSSSYLALSSGNELEYYNSSGVIDTLYLQYSGTAAQLKGPGGAQIWMDSNDGSGSGLDADLLDGQHGSYYAPSSSLASYVLKSGDTMTGALTINSAGSYPLQLSSSQRYQLRIRNTAATAQTAGWWLAHDGGGSLYFHADSTGDRAYLTSGGTLMSTGDMRSPIFYDSDNTSYYWNPNTSSAHRLQTPTGYLDLGSMNSSWCHFQTDRPGFYFGVKTSHDGGISAYDSNDYAYFPIYYDYNDTGYYLDANSTSRLNTTNITTLTVYGNSNLGDGNGDTTWVNDILYVGASDSGDSHFYLGENSSSWYGDHWYWDSAYTVYRYSRYAGTDSLIHYHDTRDTTRITYGRNIVFDNYGKGIVGTYASTRYQGVFAMGDSYKLPADGSTTGTLYGLAWSHPNAGGVAANLNTHGLLAMENGTWLASLSGSVRARDDMRAPIFYDSNDTSYYINPNSLSVFNQLNMWGRLAVDNPIDYASSAVTGLTSAPLSSYALYDTNVGSTSYFLPFTHQTALYTSGYRTHCSTGLYKYASGWGDNNTGWYVALGGSDSYPTMHWKLTYGSDLYNSNGYVSQPGSFRAPIFYDTNDTAYYVDARSASVLSGLKLNGVDNNASGNDYILWINKPNNNDWGVSITGQYDYNYMYDGAASHSYGVRGLAAGGEYWRVGTDLLYHNSNIRAPIFYDQNNTGYYVDPASTTYINVLTTAGNITSNSDIRLKRDIQKITNATDKVKKLNGVTFTRIDVEDTTKRYAGLIAQEVLEVLPEAVEGTATYSVAYGNMVGLLVEAIKEQQSEIDELKSLVKQLLAK
jgi:hypothetical protein